MGHNSQELLNSVINDKTEFKTKIIGIPRASSIDKACMRMHVLMSKYQGMHKKESLDFNSRLTFAWGDALHSMIQNTEVVIRDSIKRGWWRCRACNTVLGFGRSPRRDFKCTKCGASREAMIYHEHFLEVRDPFYLTGHPDIFLELQENVLTVGELKSINKESFKRLEKPTGEHILQATSYLLGIDKNVSGLQIPKKYKMNTDYFVVIYVSKEALDRKTKAYKIFMVRRNPIFEGIVSEKLLAFKQGYDNFPDQLPECDPLCTHNQFSTSISRDCPALQQCKKFYFEGK